MPERPERPEIPHERLEIAQTKSNQLADRAEKIGLYAQGTRLGVTEDGEHLIIVTDFIVGDVAFSPRVQDPEQEAMDDSFSTIEAASAKDDFAEYQRKLMEQFGHCFGQEDDPESETDAG